MYQLYKEKYYIEYNRTISNLFGITKNINTIIFKDKILNRELLTLTLSTEDVLLIADAMSSYMSFGGYYNSFPLISFSNNYLNYIFTITPDTDNSYDIITIEEENMITKSKIERIKLVFNPHDGTEFDILEFFLEIYENLLYDIIDMETLYPDYADVYQ